MAHRNGQYAALGRRLAAVRNAPAPSSYKVPTGLKESNDTGVAAQGTGSQFAGTLASEVSRRRKDRFAQQSS